MCNKILIKTNKFIIFVCLFIYCLMFEGNSFCMYDIFDVIDSGNLKHVNIFIKKNKVALVNRRDALNSFAKGETLLNAACYKGNLEIVEAICVYLYRKNINAFYNRPNFDYCDNETNNQNKMKIWAKRFINNLGEFGNTPLICACSAKTDNLDLVKYLISVGAKDSINVKNKEGRTAVDIAFEERNFDVVEFLIENSAKLDKKYVKSLLIGASDKKYLEHQLRLFFELEKIVSDPNCENLRKKAIKKELKNKGVKKSVNNSGKKIGSDNKNEKQKDSLISYEEVLKRMHI